MKFYYFSCNIDYKKPAKFEDSLEIISKIKTISKSSFTMDQIIKRKDEIISESEIVLEVELFFLSLSPGQN